ncbi:hypothetical protein GH714_013645 [Hevea brasiliensis]|uniref:C3H1-type domain-containing protein n=1 Tax=Hevea brasiliensis TaxID=3981 RepID=A0A6A6MJ94_HEVBR|nr:hypothetical protein GH714_013645 [Hevea brasiliensis]
MKHEDEAYAIGEIAKNTHLWSSPRGPAPTQKRQAAGMYDLDPFNMINAKFDALTNVLAKKMEDLSMLVSSSSSLEFTTSGLCRGNYQLWSRLWRKQHMLARLILEYQELCDHYELSVARLQVLTNEIDSLSQENADLRFTNNELVKILSLSSQAAIQSRFTSREMVEPNRFERNTERVSLPKSISVRSSGYLKTNRASASNGGGQSSTSNRPRVPSHLDQFVPGSAQHRVCVPGRGKKEDAAVELDVYNQGMWKTELCNKWQETSTCPYGDHCQFAHGITELRPVIRHPRYKTQLCRMVLAGEMISAETPLLFSKACELFILELTLRAWLQTEVCKRRTLQRCDIARAIRTSHTLDFLAEVVPFDHHKDGETENCSDELEPLPAIQVPFPVIDINEDFVLTNHGIAQQFMMRTSTSPVEFNYEFDFKGGKRVAGGKQSSNLMINDP